MSTTYSDASGTPLHYPVVPTNIQDAEAHVVGETTTVEEENGQGNVFDTAGNIISQTATTVGGAVKDTVNYASESMGFGESL